MKLISSYDGKDVKDEKFKGEMPSGAGKPEVESLIEFILNHFPSLKKKINTFFIFAVFKRSPTHSI